MCILAKANMDSVRCDFSGFWTTGWKRPSLVTSIFYEMTATERHLTSNLTLFFVQGLCFVSFASDERARIKNLVLHLSASSTSGESVLPMVRWILLLFFSEYQLGLAGKGSDRKKGMEQQ